MSSRFTKRRILLPLLSLLLVSNTFSQDPQWNWARSFGTIEDEFAEALVVDKNNNDVYVVGNWEEDLSATFPGGTNPSTLFASTYGLQDGFVAKYDSSGTLIWAFKVGGASLDRINSIAIDQGGNIYITGYIGEDATNFFSGTSVHTASSTLSNSSDEDFFLAKYNSDGEFIWVERSETNFGHLAGLDLTLTPSAVFAVGRYNGWASIGGVNMSNTPNGDDIFLVKLSLDGTVQWIAEAGSNGSDIASEVIADESNVYYTGYFDGSNLNIKNAGGGNAESQGNVKNGFSDIILASYSQSGPLNWSQTIASQDEDRGLGMTMDMDSIYITGSLSNNANFPGYVNNPVAASSNRDIFISSLAKSDGNTGWVKVLFCSDGGDERGRCMDWDDEGNLYITGDYKRDLFFPEGVTLSAISGDDIFVTSFTTNGAFRWALSAGSSLNDAGNGLALGSGGSIYICGIHEEQMNLGSLTLPDNGRNNGYLAKLQEDCTDAVAGIVSSPQDHVCATEGITLKLTGYLGDIQWQESPSGLNTWTDISGENRDTVVVSPLDSTDYRAILSSGTCKSDTSNVIKLLVYEIPVANAGTGGETCGLIFGLTAVPTVGKGYWSLKSGPGSVSFSPADTIPDALATVTQYGSYKFTWREENGSCTSEDSISVNFLEPPLADPGPGGETCGNTLGLQAFPSVGTGEWTQTSGPGSTLFIPSINDPIVNVIVDAFGTYEYTWTETNGICSDDSSIMVRFFEPPTILPGAGGDICGLDFSLNAVPSVGSGKWSLSGGPGTAAFSPSDTVPDPVVTVSEYGSYSFTWVELNGPCSPGATIFVDFYESPVADPGPGGETCGLTFNLNAVASIGTGTWSFISGPGTAVFLPSDDNPDTDAIVSAYGTYEFQWRETNGFCSDDSIIRVIYTAPPTSDAGFDAELCIDAGSYAIDLSTSSNGTVLWTSSGDGSFAADTLDNPVYLFGSDSDSVILIKTVQSTGTCIAAVDSMVLTLTPLPLSIAGPEREICISDGLLTISGSSSDHGDILWSSSGDGFFNDPTLENPLYTLGSETDQVMLHKSVSSLGSCPDVTDSMTLTITPLPVSNAGTDVEICSSDGEFNISGTISAHGDILWTSNSDGTFEDATAENPVYTLGSETGRITLYKTVSSLGSCLDATDSMDLVITPAPLSYAGANGEICISDALISISGSTSANGPVLWSSSGNGSFDLPSVDNPSYSLGLETDSVFLIKTVGGSGSCSDAVDSARIFLTPLPFSDAGVDIEICNGEGVLQIGATSSANGVIEWSTSGSGTFDDPATDNPEYLFGAESGSFILTKTVYSFGSCPVDADSLSLSLIPSPVALAGPGGETCLLEFKLNAGLPSTPGVWSKISGPGTASFTPDINDPSAHISVSEFGNYSFLWTISDGPCSDSDSVQVTFIESFEVNAGNGGSQCGLEFSLSAVDGPGSGKWTQISGPGSALFEPSDTLSNPLLTVSEYGTYSLAWTESFGDCSGSDTIELSFYRQPEANAGPDQVLEAEFETILEANNPVSGSGSWSIFAGSGLFEDIQNPATRVSGLSVGINELIWTIRNGVCADVSDNVLITVIEGQTPTIITPNADGLNDFLEFPQINQEAGCSIIIYNRWGTEVYRNENYNNDWDGKDHKGRELLNDTYFYILKIPPERIIKSYVEIRK